MVRKRGLSRQKVLRAAVELVDARGVEALSMRRLGEVLGVEAMSLYRHVASKADLLDGVHEAILGEMELPKFREERDWVEVATALGSAFYGALMAHPNALSLFATRPAVTPGSLAYVEVALGVLERAGFSAKASVSLLQALVGYAVGHALMHSGAGGGRVNYAGLDSDEFPRLVKVAPVLGSYDDREAFEFGLRMFLLGAERWLEGQE